MESAHVMALGLEHIILLISTLEYNYLGAGIMVATIR